MRPAALLAFLLALLIGAAPARADGSLIALLPLAADAKLSIYGQPVASEIARALEREGFSIVVVTSTAPVPAKARLVIDGRIVKGDRGTVLLEARVRDPGRGTIIAALRATAPSLTRIDEAVGDLAPRLAEQLRAGLAAQDEAAKPTPAPIVRKPDEVATAPTAPVAAPVDRRPLALISIADASRRGADDPAMPPLLRAGAIRLAGQVGHRSTDLQATDGDDLAVAVQARRAHVAVHVELLDIEYDDEGGVITAKARARVRVVAASAEIFDRVVRTDTLVGGRGDRRDAVARAAVAQIVDIAMPRVRDRLKTP